MSKQSQDQFATVRRCIDVANSFAATAAFLSDDVEQARAEIKQAEEREANSAKWFAEHIPAAFNADDPCQCALCKALREWEAKWRERIEELKAAFGHYHKAGEGDHIDKCAKCGLDIRDDIHYRELKP